MDKKEQTYGAIVLVSIFLALLVTAICLEMKQIRIIEGMFPQKPTEFVEDFTMLSESSFHSNLSDKSCVTVSIANDTVWIETVNSEMVSYNCQTHTLWVMARYSGHWLTEATFDLDTIFSAEDILSKALDNVKLNH
jgi:hypothetical protein